MSSFVGNNIQMYAYINYPNGTCGIYTPPNDTRSGEAQIQQEINRLMAEFRSKIVVTRVYL